MNLFLIFDLRFSIECFNVPNIADRKNEMGQSQIENQESKIETLRPLVEAETGMDFAGSRFTRLCEAVERVLVKSGNSTELDGLLANPLERGLFLERLTAELTVGESFFFRNEHHFQALREEVIPELLRRNAERRELRMWSAGCATGEEPYSLSILADQMLLAPMKDRYSQFENQTSAWQVSILATDINPEFLRRARQAEYRSWSFRRTEIQQDPRYFEIAGDNYRLLPHVRDHVRFVYLNLVKDVYPSPLTGTVGLDLFLFRNVAIYLKPAVVRAIVEKFYHCLHPGGWLLLGEAEVSQVQPEEFDVRRIGQATFFQKPRVGAPAEPLAQPRPVLPPVYFTEPPSGAVVPLARVTDRPPLAAEAAASQVNVPTDMRPRSPTAASAVGPTLQFDWEHVEQCLLREEFDAVESALDKIRDRSERANMKWKYVRRLLDLSEITRATKTLDACLHEEPLMIEGHMLKASLAEERGDLAEAQAACRRALYLDRNCAMAHFHLALVQQLAGDAAGARKSLRLVEKLAKTQEPNALVAHGDGVCYGRLYEMAEAMLEF